MIHRQSLKTYIKTAALAYRIDIMRMIMYKANLVGFVLSGILWSLLVLFTTYFMIRNVTSVFGYTSNDFIALSAIQVMFLGFFHTVFTPNMNDFLVHVQQGTLDYLLLSPLDIQWMTGFFRVRVAVFVRVFIGASILIALHLGGRIQVPSIAHVFGFMFFLVFGFMLVYSVWTFFCTLLFWLPHLNNMVEFLHILNTVSRFPMEFYGEIGFIVFIVYYPLSSVFAIPYKVLIGRITVQELVYFSLVSIASLVFARRFFLFGLRHYTSSSG